MNPPIHQIYCTHCTFGTSALERRTGDIAERVLGYSARASSLEREELRKAFRQIERYLYYSLPTDAPSEEKLRLDAATAPQRMIFLPSISGLQAIGQISYRRMDTSHRVGSYFGHFLLAERNTGAWSVLDCLQLWGAKWMAEDSPEIPFKLATFPQLESFRPVPRPIIDDRLLFSFLTTSAGKKFDDPKNVIPLRWRDVPQADRASLLTALVRAYLELGTDRRESALLVVEPSLAALLFYGVARLLPAGHIREDISFSTFEPVADRLPTTLAATIFHDPLASDLKPEAYRRAGWVMNTFLNRRSVNPPRSKGLYSRLLVDTLISEGWRAVDNLLASFQAADPTRSAELELLAENHNLARELLDPQSAVKSTAWRNSPVVAAFIVHAVRQNLAAHPPEAPRWKELAACPNGMTLLELLASSAKEPVEMSSVLGLLRQLPVQKLPDLLASGHVSSDFKVEAVTAYIERTGSFPMNCPELWDDAGFLFRVFSRLTLPRLIKLREQLPTGKMPAFFVAVVQAAKQDPLKQPLVSGLVNELDDDELVDILERHSTELQSCVPRKDLFLGIRLCKILDDLPNDPYQFSQRLDVLDAWSEFFDDPGETEKCVASWKSLRKEILALRDGTATQETHSKKLDRFHNDSGRKIAAAVQQAMSDRRYVAYASGDRKYQCLEKFVPVLAGQRACLPDRVWELIRKHLDASSQSLIQSQVPAGLPPLPSSILTSQDITNAGITLPRSNKFAKSDHKIFSIAGIVLLFGVACVGLSIFLRGSGSGSESSQLTKVSTAQLPETSQTSVPEKASGTTSMAPKVDKTTPGANTILGGDSNTAVGETGQSADASVGSKVGSASNAVQPSSAGSENRNQIGEGPVGNAKNPYPMTKQSPDNREGIPQSDNPQSGSDSAKQGQAAPVITEGEVTQMQPPRAKEELRNKPVHNVNTYPPPAIKGGPSTAKILATLNFNPEDAYPTLHLLGDPNFTKQIPVMGHESNGNIEVFDTNGSTNTNNLDRFEFFVVEKTIKKGVFELKCRCNSSESENSNRFWERLCLGVLQMKLGNQTQLVGLMPVVELKPPITIENKDNAFKGDIKIKDLYFKSKTEQKHEPPNSEIAFHSLKFGEGILYVDRDQYKFGPDENVDGQCEVPELAHHLGVNHVRIRLSWDPNETSWVFTLDPFDKIKERLASKTVQLSGILYRTVRSDDETEVRVPSVVIMQK